MEERRNGLRAAVDQRESAKIPRMRNRAGQQIRVLTPLSAETRAADAAAFSALMRHVKAVDGEPHIVIMAQVENEPGSLESDRDYSPEATRLFEGQVPRQLALSLHKQPGTWKDVFGQEEASEALPRIPLPAM